MSSAGAPASFVESVSGSKTLSGTTTLSGPAVLSGATTAISSAATTLSGASTTISSAATTLSGASTTISSAATTISGALTLSGAVTVTGSVTGGVRQLLPFGMLNIAAGDNATPASSTPVQIFWSAASGLTTCGFVALRAGSVVGLSANLNAAAAGSNCIVGVYKNGTIINASAIVTLASGTSDTKANGTFTAGSYTFVAGDVIDVRIRTGSGWSATTADMSVAVEIA